MNILFFSRLFYPHVGGVETHVLEVGKGLIGQVHTVVAVTEDLRSLGFDVSKEQNDVVEGIRIVRMPVGKAGPFQKFRIWWWLWRHRDLIRKADIVHCHDVFFWYLPFRFLYPEKPVFTTFHGYETKFPPTKKAILVRKLSEKLSKGNICVGDYISKWYGTKPSYVTYGAVGINTNTTNKYQYYQSKNRKVKIVFVGRLEDDMGVRIYLQVLRILKEQKSNFTFDVFGDGSLQKEAAKLGKVHGFVENIQSKIATSNFVFASSYLSILQAMAMKKLVFAVYNNPLKGDYLTLTPFEKYIIISNNPKHIAEKLFYFSEHVAALEYLVNKGYSWVKKQSWDKVANVYEELWGIQ